MSTWDREQPRAMGPFSVPGAVREALALLRSAEGVTAPPKVDADQLHAVEVGVGYRFREDLLALFAARLPSMAERYSLSLDSVVGHTGALRALGAPGDLVGFGRDGEMFLALSLRQQSITGTEIVRFAKDGGLSPVRVMLGEWLSSLAQAAPLAQGSVPAFVPEIVRALPRGSSGRLVRHKTFGEGRVYLETGSGPTRKVKVDFPKIGLKTLQARFLEFVDE